MNIKDDRIEATLLTFKMVLDAKGNLWTDIGGLPLKEVKHICVTLINGQENVKTRCNNIP